MNKGHINDRVTGYRSNKHGFPAVTGLQSSVVLGNEFDYDPLALEKYLATVRREEYLESEKNLLKAVLKDGVSTYQKHISSTSRAGEKLFREAEEWISNKGREGMFSFESVCEALGLNSNYVRGLLLKWKENYFKAPKYQANNSQLKLQP